MLEYYLEDNQLAGETGALKAQVVNVRSNSADDVIDQIMEIGAGLTRSDVMSVFAALKQVCVNIIERGEAINTDLVAVHPSVPGTFRPDKTAGAQAHLSYKSGPALKAAAARIKTRRVASPQTGAIIENVRDVKSGSLNAEITRGRDIRITGSKVKLVGEAPEVGVYFVNMATGEQIKVDPEDVVESTASNLIVTVPDLPAGALVKLEIVTQYSGAGIPLKTPRSATFDKPLTVI